MFLYLYAFILLHSVIVIIDILKKKIYFRIFILNLINFFNVFIEKANLYIMEGIQKNLLVENNELQ